MCGFENFDIYFVRIDILERLFILILNSNKEGGKNNYDIKLIRFISKAYSKLISKLKALYFNYLTKLLNYYM